MVWLARWVWSSKGGYVASGTANDGHSTTDPVYYKGLGYFDGGAVATYGGLAVGGHVGASSNSACQHFHAHRPDLWVIMPLAPPNKRA
jgi:hypothetical protein